MSLTKRQSEIIDAALKLTAEGGIQNLTIKNLGNALGITEPAIYRHFRSKSEIVRTMIGRFDETASGRCRPTRRWPRRCSPKSCSWPTRNFPNGCSR